VRRALLLAISVLLIGGAATLLAGCGGKTVSPTAETVVGELNTTNAASTTPQLPGGDADAGEPIFTSAGCNGCHTMEAAGATGNVGPNLDQLAPELEAIQTQVINGGGGMPPYKGQLSDKEIADVSQYVYESTHGEGSSPD
jgi:mono/diheme cytochrome c family protein